MALPRAGEDADPVVHGLRPSERWRDVLSGEERSIEDSPRLSELVDAETGVGIYESRRGSI